MSKSRQQGKDSDCSLFIICETTPGALRLVLGPGYKKYLGLDRVWQRWPQVSQGWSMRMDNHRIS